MKNIFFDLNETSAIKKYFQKTNDLVFEINGEGKILEVNPSFEKEAEMESGALRGSYLFQFLHHNSMKTWKKALEEGFFRPKTYAYFCFNNRTLLLELLSLTPLDENHFLAIARLSKNKAAFLKETKIASVFDSILNSIDDYVSIMDESFSVVYCNHHFNQFFNEGKNFQGSNMTVLQEKIPGLKLEKHIQEVFKNGKKKKIQKSIRHKGKKIDLSFEFLPIKNNLHIVQYIVCKSSDITQLKRNKEETELFDFLFKESDIFFFFLFL